MAVLWLIKQTRNEIGWKKIKIKIHIKYLENAPNYLFLSFSPFIYVKNGNIFILLHVPTNL
jgi:hypothetical protein